ncbi:hypothetical protein [Heterosigma akashiwo virus 01]|uniref:Uncharacterized protein n=1 Tax=Heterosigma akashiwo virus 01 TaxID=97195 RepID=A0A1C9C5E0_HAV01|nr:hypothetical protein D1R72_gp166 [Heterosigma akashiwo virus 01]AOM63497.1 hypothetical protein [Heterosigma akashiwo virus 01]
MNYKDESIYTTSQAIDIVTEEDKTLNNVQQNNSMKNTVNSNTESFGYSKIPKHKTKSILAMVMLSASVIYLVFLVNVTYCSEKKRCPSFEKFYFKKIDPLFELHFKQVPFGLLLLTLYLALVEHNKLNLIGASFMFFLFILYLIYRSRYLLFTDARKHIKR